MFRFWQRAHILRKLSMAVRRHDLNLRTANFAQSLAMCGSACLRIVFAYSEKNVREQQIAHACRTSPHSGTTGTNLALPGSDAIPK
jgi:hypothetical protein